MPARGRARVPVPVPAQALLALALEQREQGLAPAALPGYPPGACSPVAALPGW